MVHVVANVASSLNIKNGFCTVLCCNWSPTVCKACCYNCRRGKQSKQNFISMTSHRLINVHWKINTYIVYKMVIAGGIRRQIYVCLGCPPFMADIINEQRQ